MRSITSKRPGGIRYRMLAYLFVCVVINYMDRSNIAVAASAISNDLNLSSVKLGLVFSAFGWTYAALQIPSGVLVDHIDTRWLYAFSLVSWSAATLLQGAASGFAVLLALRFAIGAFEAPAYPLNNRIVTNWFPDEERASAIAIYTSGQFAGLAFLTPALAVLQHYAGWRGLFLITGSIGMVWGLMWYFIYRDPLEHRRISKGELEYIEKGGGLISNRGKQKKPEESKFQWSNLRQVLVHRKLWGIYIGQFAVNATLWFFLTWFPTYLIRYRGLNFLKSGFLSAAPFLAALAGLLLSGFFSDYLVKKKVSMAVARKMPVIAGLLLSVSIIGANYVSSTALIIFFMCTAFFGNGFASITWVFVSALAPKRLVGLTGGVFNFIGALASIIVPVVIGYLVKDGNFKPALIFIGTIAAIGACSYIFLVGKVERIEVKEDATEIAVSTNGLDTL